MTKEEAYNAMQEGLCVSHKDLAEDEFLYMDENYIIRDENGDEFESTWDVKTSERWLSDWYIYKGKGSKKRGILHIESKEQYRISHIYGQPCPGKGSCIQYNQAGETACIVCDVNDSKRAKLLEDINYFIEDGNGQNVSITMNEILEEKDIPRKPSLLKRILLFFMKRR